MTDVEMKSSEAKDASKDTQDTKPKEEEPTDMYYGKYSCRNSVCIP